MVDLGGGYLGAFYSEKGQGNSSGSNKLGKCIGDLARRTVIGVEPTKKWGLKIHTQPGCHQPPKLMHVKTAQRQVSRGSSPQWRGLVESA